MKRLLLSALLAVLVHVYWLFSNIGQGESARPGKAPRSVVISLATVQRPASGARTERERDVEPAAPLGERASAAAQPVIKEPKGEPTEGDRPFDEEVATTPGNSVEPEPPDASLPADTPIIEQADRPLAESRPKTQPSTNPTREVVQEEVARKTKQRPQAAKPKSQPARSGTPVAKSKHAVQEIRQLKSVAPQAGYPKPGDDAPDLSGEAQPDRGAGARGKSLIREALDGVLKQARPLYKRNPRPPYPQVARRRGYEGKVVVRALVGKDGLVDQVRLDQSSGYDTLDGAALQTVQQWAFEPALRGSEKIEMWVRIPLRFSLN